MPHFGHGPLDVVNLIANLGIVGGYLLIPFTVLSRIAVTRFVRIAGLFFFATCAMTHFAHAMGWLHLWPLAVNHVVQAVAVWCFVLGFARLVVHANQRVAARAAAAAAAGTDGGAACVACGRGT